MKYSFVFFMMFVALVFSCSPNNSSKKIVQEWSGKQVLLPSDSLLFNLDKNSPKPHLKNIKILSLINGGCGPCIEELEEWKLFMKKVDTSQVGFMFLVHSVDIIEDFMLKDSLYIKLNYPYYYDRGHKIIQKNKFSENKTFQTFLLGKNNKVVLIGKPNTNEMSQLYIKQIKKMLN